MRRVRAVRGVPVNLRNMKLSLLATVIPERTWEELHAYEVMRNRCAQLAAGDWVRSIGLSFYFGMIAQMCRASLDRTPMATYLTAALEGWWLNDCYPPDLRLWFYTHRSAPMPSWLKPPRVAEQAVIVTR